MRQNEEYNEKFDDTIEYKEQLPPVDFQCAQCLQYGHCTHQCEDAWTEVL